jgi:T-complex protein 1 subunit gamma
MKALNVWDSVTVKSQVIKSAVESACLLLRVDDIVSGMKKKQQQGGANPAAAPHEDMETPE